MLIHFTFQNFRSFRDEKTLSLEASTDKELNESVIRSNGSLRLLPAAVMYGANSSGKSNVIMALNVMRRVLLTSVKLNPNDELDFRPFRLDLSSETTPTSFEIEFIESGVRYRYGFDYNKKRICKEWLYEKISGQREYFLFLRDKDDISVSNKRFPEGKGKEDATPSNRLFVSLVAQLNGSKSMNVLEWFHKCNFISGMHSQGYEGFTLNMFSAKSEGYSDALDFFHKLDLGFIDLKVTEEPIDEIISNKVNLTDSMRAKLLDKYKGGMLVEAKTTHHIYDEAGNIIREEAFDKDEMESEGSKKIIEMSGPLFDTLKNGKVLVVDELDAKLHPMLTRSILRLFMSPKTNPRGAQLIFATHDVNLLNLSYLRRDQIWFTEKDRTESSDLYSLIEFSDATDVPLRGDDSILKNYINGRYGAIPFLN